MYRYFEEEINDLKTRIVNMSIYVEEMIFNAVMAVKDYDIQLARKVIEKDDIVDRMEIDIDEKCVGIILRHHPLAKDLRFVLAALKINNDLERIADLAVDICWRVTEFFSEKNLRKTDDIEAMGHKVIEMLRKSIKSLTEKNIDIAKEVIFFDSKIDEIRNKINDDIINIASFKSDKSKYLFSLMLTTRHLERIADHCVNISEDVIYILDSKIVKHHHQEI